MDRPSLGLLRLYVILCRTARHRELLIGLRSRQSRFQQCVKWFSTHAHRRSICEGTSLFLAAI